MAGPVRRRTGVRTWPTVVALFGQFWLVITGPYGRFRVSVQARLDIRLSAKENIHANAKTTDTVDKASELHN